MTSTRYLTLLWPGLPWLWLRGSVAGLILALAFGVALDMAILLTWVWTELVATELALGLWAATAGVWAVATLSAVTTFPPPLPTGRNEAAEALFVAAQGRQQRIENIVVNVRFQHPRRKVELDRPIPSGLRGSTLTSATCHLRSNRAPQLELLFEAISHGGCARDELGRCLSMH